MEDIKDIEPSKIEEYLNKLGDWALNKGFQLVLAILCMYIGMKLSKLILGTASLAIGLALQGSLANFAGGVLILILKPFRVGDYIIENDKQCEGMVVSIDIFYTKLQTYDNRIIVIPNGNITSHSVVNVTAAGTRKLDIAVGVAYDSDLKKVKDTLYQVVAENQYYDKTKEIDVFVDSFGDSSIKMGVRCMVATENYWKAKWEIQEAIKYAFDAQGIEIPFDQMEVTLKNKDA